MTAQRGWWNMACWNALSEAQQQHLIEVGNLPIFSDPEGTACSNGAEVSIETMDDAAPGPRFYCRPCALAYLSGAVGRSADRPATSATDRPIDAHSGPQPAMRGPGEVEA